MFKVKAVLKGYYNHLLLNEGKVFYIKNAKEFSFEWMKSLDSKLDKELVEIKKSRPVKKAPTISKPSVKIEDPIEDPIEDDSHVNHDEHEEAAEKPAEPEHDEHDEHESDEVI